MKNLEKFIANDKLFTSAFFDKDLIDKNLNDVNKFLLKECVIEKYFLSLKAYLDHWSRCIEYQYVCLNIAKFIIDKKKNYQDKNFQILDNASGDPLKSSLLANYSEF